MIDTKLGREIELNAGPRNAAKKGLFEVMTTGTYAVFKNELCQVLSQSN
jgi:hypothetical protein